MKIKKTPMPDKGTKMIFILRELTDTKIIAGTIIKIPNAETIAGMAKTSTLLCIPAYALGVSVKLCP
jgi:hypothetical protein